MKKVPNVTNKNFPFITWRCFKYRDKHSAFDTIPNPTLKRDCAKARSPLAPRWATS